MDAYARASIGTGYRRCDSLDRINAASRSLFLARGYHDTKPQDIARQAGLGHGTFYLHYRDKRECFLAFLGGAREEFCLYMRTRISRCDNVEQTIALTVDAINDFSDQTPGLLNAVMTDDTLFDVKGAQLPTSLLRWGTEWAVMVQHRVVAGGCDPKIVGQAMLGAINHCRLQSERMDVSREQVKANLTQLLTRALTVTPERQSAQV